VAVALLVPATAPYGALAAATLLLGFSGTIATNLARGRSPDCHCFGQLHSSPAGPMTLARTILLAAGATLVAVLAWDDPGPTPVAWLSDLDDASLVSVIAAATVAGLAAAGAWLAIHLLRAYGRLLVRVEELEARLGEDGMPMIEHYEPGPGLAIGSEAPAFELESVDGETVSLDQLLEPARRLMLVFADPDCGPCRTLMPEVAAWERDLADELTIAVISGGGAEDSRKHARRHRLKRVLLQGEGALSASFEAFATPAGVLISPDGKIDSYVAQGPDAIGELVDAALAPPAEEQPAGLPIGAEAPELELPTLDGARLSVRDLRGEEALLTFWNPACGFCQAMRDELKAWEAQTNGDGPRLVIVSSGDREAIEGEGFRSTIILDDRDEAVSAFQAAGTPMAVLIDADGRIASPLAAGREAVLGLARGGARSAA
jgi:peroxiredoxin